MLDFIRQYGVAIFGILLSATLSIILYFKNHRQKQLCYEIEFSMPVITKMNQDIKIFYKDTIEITETLKMVSIRFINSGNKPIKRADFESDILLKFSNSNGSFPQIYEINIDQRKPSDLAIEVFNDDFGCHSGFKPLLLNPKDEFHLNILMTNYDKLAVSTRIVGGEVDIHKKVQKRLFKRLDIALNIALNVVLIVSVIIVVLYWIYKLSMYFI